MEFFVLQPKAIDLADVAGSDERLDSLPFKIFHKIGEFILSEKGLNLIAFLSCVTADHLIETAPPAQLVDDEAADLLMVV